MVEGYKTNNMQQSKGFSKSFELTHMRSGDTNKEISRVKWQTESKENTENKQIRILFIAAVVKYCLHLYATMYAFKLEAKKLA